MYALLYPRLIHPIMAHVIFPASQFPASNLIRLRNQQNFKQKPSGCVLLCTVHETTVTASLNRNFSETLCCSKPQEPCELARSRSHHCTLNDVHYYNASSHMCVLCVLCFTAIAEFELPVAMIATLWLQCLNIGCLSGQHAGLPALHVDTISYHPLSHVSVGNLLIFCADAGGKPLQSRSTPSASSLQSVNCCSQANQASTVLWLHACTSLVSSSESEAPLLLAASPG